MRNLQKGINTLTTQVEKLNNHRLIRLNDSLWKMIGTQFLRGLAFGLGSVVGATILVSVLVYSLSSIDFIPIVGDWAGRIIQMIETR